MTIKLKGSTDGSVSLQAPADTSPTGTDITLTLPTTAGSADQFVKNSGTAGTFEYSSMVETSTGVGIGTSSPDRLLELAGSGGATSVELRLNATDGGERQITFTGSGSNTHTIKSTGTTDNSLVFVQGADERMRITSSGHMVIGKTTADVTGTGCEFRSDGFASLNRSSNSVLFVNRKTDDGIIVDIRQNNTREGTISVSGSTVSYNGGHLSRWSQLAGGAERTEILRGSVLSNLDEMCEWSYEAQDAVLYTEDDELPEGVSVGDVKTPAVAAGTEDNEQLNRMKVSDVEGDVNVSGVFQCWDDDDDTYTNDFYCAMTGDFVIRIAQGTTVARGDLLMSAGDGTAKPQDDDIVRSKTIAKVTSTVVSETYADGSYCVPCVLTAC